MLTDVKENGAVVFLGKLYNIIPGKKPFTRTFNSAPSAFSYTAVELFQVTAHLYAASSL